MRIETQIPMKQRVQVQSVTRIQMKQVSNNQFACDSFFLVMVLQKRVRKFAILCIYVY